MAGPVDDVQGLDRPWGRQVHTTTGSGPAVLLVHGWSCSARSWDDVVPPLVEAGHQVVTYDIRGHGASDRDGEPVTLPELVADVEALIDHLGLDRPVVAGHSLGGMVAIELALARPHAVAGLALIDTGLTPREADHELRGQLAASVLDSDDASAWWPLLVPVLYSTGFVEAHPEHLAAARERFVAGGLRAKSAVFAALADRRDPTPLLADWSIPTLVVVGDQDAIWDVAAHEGIVATIPGSRLSVVDGAGHMSVEERPEAVAALIASFAGPLT